MIVIKMNKKIHTPQRTKIIKMDLYFDNPVYEHDKYTYTQQIDNIDWHIMRFARIKITGDIDIEKLLDMNIDICTSQGYRTFSITNLIYTAMLTDHKCKLSRNKLSISLPKNVCMNKQTTGEKWTNIIIITRQLLNIQIKIKDSKIWMYDGIQILTNNDKHEKNKLEGTIHFIGYISQYNTNTLTIIDRHYGERDIKVVRKRLGDYCVCIAPLIEMNIENFCDLYEAIDTFDFGNDYYNVCHVLTDTQQINMQVIECMSRINFD
jgi:hypothetical protein